MFMMIGVINVRVSPQDWNAAGWFRRACAALVTQANVSVDVGVAAPRILGCCGVCFA